MPQYFPKRLLLLFSCNRNTEHQWKFSWTPAMGAACEESLDAVATEKCAVHVAEARGTHWRPCQHSSAFLIRSTIAMQPTTQVYNSNISALAGQSWSSQAYRVSDNRHRKNVVTASSTVKMTSRNAAPPWWWSWCSRRSSPPRDPLSRLGRAPSPPMVLLIAHHNIFVGGVSNIL
jgi:hypothetical protein